MRALLVVWIVGVASLAGCAARLQPPGGLAGGTAAPAAVERFLQFVSARDYSGMGWVFGTADGPVIARDPPPQVEQRMYALASLLEHDSFVIGNPAPVPGRAQETLRFDVIIQRGMGAFAVPFIAVRGPQGRWFVEQVSVEAITGR